MNSVIKRYTNDFFYLAVDSESIALDEFQSKLKKELSRFYKLEEKFVFVDDFMLQVESYYKEHLKECTAKDPNDCLTNQTCENALYFTRQEKEYLNKQMGEEAEKRIVGTYIGNLNVSGNNALVNFGNIRDSIFKNISQLDALGKANISTSIKKLTEAIECLTEIDAQTKNEQLDNLKFLSEQALLEQDKRVGKGVIKTTIKGLFSTLNTMKSLSSISGYTLKDIAEFFLGDEQHNILL